MEGIGFFLVVFLGGGIPGLASGPNFPSPRVTILALRLDCSTAALTQKVFSDCKLFVPKMLGFSDPTRTGITTLTLAAGMEGIDTRKKSVVFGPISKYFAHL